MLQGLRAHLGIHPHDVVVTGEEQVQQALNGAAVAGPLRPAGRREKRGSAHSVQGSHSAWAIGCAQHWQQAQRQHALLARTARRSAPRGPAWGRGRPPASLPAPPSLRARRLRECSSIEVQAPSAAIHLWCAPRSAASTCLARRQHPPAGGGCARWPPPLPPASDQTLAAPCPPARSLCSPAGVGRCGGGRGGEVSSATRGHAVCSGHRLPAAARACMRAL